MARNKEHREDNSKINKGLWDFIENHRYSTIFHTHRWKKVIEKTYSLNFSPFIIRSETGIIGYCPFFNINNKLVLPFSYLNTPLLDGKEEVMKNKFNNKLNNNKFILNSLIELDFKGENKTNLNNNYSTYIINLHYSTELINKKIHKSIKRSIKKNKDEVSLRINNSKEALNNFMLLNRLTRKKHGVPHQPDKFFYNIYSELIENNKGDIIECEFDNIIIASMILFKHNDKVLYAYGASNTKYNKFSANYKLINYAIFHYKKQGFNYLDLGRAQNNTGLAKFKERWGSDIISLYYYSNIKNYLNENRESRKYRLITNLWAKTPFFITNLVNDFVFKRFFLK
jgi:hypothetical protein